MRFTNVKIEKINGFTFKMFKMVLASFQVKNKLKKAWFFQETFLLGYFSIEVILKMFFPIFSNTNL